MTTRPTTHQIVHCFTSDLFTCLRFWEPLTGIMPMTEPIQSPWVMIRKLRLKDSMGGSPPHWWYSSAWNPGGANFSESGILIAIPFCEIISIIKLGMYNGTFYNPTIPRFWSQTTYDEETVEITWTHEFMEPFIELKVHDFQDIWIHGYTICKK